MQAYSTTFPLRTIQVQLQNKEQTAIEAEAFVLYGNLHNQLWAIKMHWQQCLQKLQELYNCMNHCEAAYAALEKETMRYGPIGGFAGDDNPAADNEEYTLKLSTLQNRLKDFAACADEYNQASATLLEMHRRGMELEEAFDESFSHFDRSYFSPIISNYDHVQVDTPSFDRDFDKFRECCDEVREMLSKFEDDWDALNPRADVLKEKVQVIDRYIININKGLELNYSAGLDDSKAALN